MADDKTTKMPEQPVTDTVSIPGGFTPLFRRLETIVPI